MRPITPSYTSLAERLFGEFQRYCWSATEQRPWKDIALFEQLRWIAVAVAVRPGPMTGVVESLRSVFQASAWEEVSNAAKRADRIERFFAKLHEYIPTTIQIHLGPKPEEIASLVETARAIQGALDRMGLTVETVNMPNNGASTSAPS